MNTDELGRAGTVLLLMTVWVVAQSNSPTSQREQSSAERDYSGMLAHIQQGDMNVDFKAFRIAGAQKSGRHASAIEAGERVQFRNLMASGETADALASANRALDRNYASLIAHFDAMTACQVLGKTSEAADHERVLNALLDSIRLSGDGNGPETAYYVVTTQEEYIFLGRVLHLKATSQALVMQNGHAFDRLSVVDANTRTEQYVWFNADYDFSGL
jgi:hypothetical protein